MDIKEWCMINKMRRIFGKGAEAVKRRQKGMDIFQYVGIKSAKSITGPGYGIAIINEEYNLNRLTPKLMGILLHNLDVLDPNT